MTLLSGHDDGTVLVWLAEGTHGLQRLRHIAAPATAGCVRGLTVCHASALLLVAHAGGIVAIRSFQRQADAGDGQLQQHVLLKVGPTPPAASCGCQSCFAAVFELLCACLEHDTWTQCRTRCGSVDDVLRAAVQVVKKGGIQHMASAAGAGFVFSGSQGIVRVSEADVLRMAVGAGVLQPQAPRPATPPRVVLPPASRRASSFHSHVVWFLRHGVCHTPLFCLCLSSDLLLRSCTAETS